MSDVVVSVAKGVWADWLAEGELPGQDRWPCFSCVGDGRPCFVCEGTGELTPGDQRWAFHMGGRPPKIAPGERVYIVAHGRLRGYSPLIRVDDRTEGDVFGVDRAFALVRGGGAVACTIDEPIRGFQGFRYRWWEREAEVPFPEFATAGVS